MKVNRVLGVGLALLIGLFGTLACGDDDDSNGNGGTGGTTASGGSQGGAGGSSSGGTTTGGAAQTGGSDAGGMGGELSDIVDTAVAAGNFTKLAELLTAADLVDTLKGPGPYTVFAPTDDAFAAFESENPGVLGSLTTEQVSNVLRYHVVDGAVYAADLTAGDVETLADDMASFQVNLGESVTITDDSALTDDATVTTTDIQASNGVIHVIDAVLVPETP